MRISRALARQARDGPHPKARPVVRRHCQDTNDNCGPACVQMVVSSKQRRRSPNAVVPSQEEIRRHFHHRWQDWGASPHEIAAALNAMLGTTGWKVVDESSSPRLISLIQSAMVDHETPAIITDGGQDHWMVVTSAYKVDGAMHLCVLDPTPANGFDDAPFRHSFSDDCGKKPMLNTLVPVCRKLDESFDVLVKVNGHMRALGIIYDPPEWQITKFVRKLKRHLPKLRLPGLR